MVTADAAVWDGYLAIKAHAAARSLRSKPFHNLEEAQELFDKTYAVGHHSQSGPSQPPTAPTTPTAPPRRSLSPSPDPDADSASCAGSQAPSGPEDPGECSSREEDDTPKQPTPSLDATAGTGPSKKRKLASAASAVAEGLDRLAARKAPSISIIQEAMNLVHGDDLGTDMLMGATHVFTDITKAAMFCTLDAANRKLFLEEWI
ncbi:hypothetical protein DFS34DRAFT_221043 [Phlyctochytrium arcticum]|nr:hypothetical protein DFS34DRAFT_221043 [Phlyctochytrium arcticum]